MTACANPDNLAGFYAVWVKSWENFTLPTLIFLFIFTICLELEKKIIYSKTIGVSNYLSELNLRKVNAKAHQPFMRLDFFLYARARA